MKDSLLLVHSFLLFLFNNNYNHHHSKLITSSYHVFDAAFLTFPSGSMRIASRQIIDTISIECVRLVTFKLENYVLNANSCKNLQSSRVQHSFLNCSNNVAQSIISTSHHSPPYNYFASLNIIITCAPG